MAETLPGDLRATPLRQAAVDRRRDPASPGLTAGPTAGSAAGDEELRLVRAACAGDRDAFYTLVSQYQRALYRTALAITRNPADAEDVLQESLLRAFQYLGQFRGESRFQTWLTQIVLNTARMKLRKEHGGLWDSLDDPGDPAEGRLPREPVEPRENPEQQLTREEIGRLLHQALRGLPRDYREVVALRDLQALSTQETADALGISVANVKTRLLRARLQLRQRLAIHLGRIG